MAGRCGRYCAGVRHEPCARCCWRDPLSLVYVLLWLLPLFLARLLVVTALQWLESSGAGRVLYFLRFPCDRQEVARALAASRPPGDDISCSCDEEIAEFMAGIMSFAATADGAEAAANDKQAKDKKAE